MKNINYIFLLRFNERFILSLSTLNSCLFLDDELNLLPVSSATKLLEAIEPNKVINTELENLINSLKSGTNEIVLKLV